MYARADGVHVDLGGIGKGYAVDRMAELMEEWEITKTLLHGGFSSLLALDPPPNRNGSIIWLSTQRTKGSVGANRRAAPSLQRIRRSKAGPYH